MSGAAAQRRTRANGEASRQRILDAAAEIAGERGYEGTTINLVSRQSGLPASSIYWHFRDKDDLIAAVIDRSFGRWAELLGRPVRAPVGASRDEALRAMLRRTGDALDRQPDFLRLGLLLVLERRPAELLARRRFVEARRATRVRTTALYRALFAGLDDAAVAALVTTTLALADGLFVASQAGELELADGFDLMATTVLAAARSFGGDPPG